MLRLVVRPALCLMVVFALCCVAFSRFVFCFVRYVFCVRLALHSSGLRAAFSDVFCVAIYVVLRIPRFLGTVTFPATSRVRIAA